MIQHQPDSDQPTSPWQDEVFQEVAAEYPDVPTQPLLVDAAAMFMVRDPGRSSAMMLGHLGFPEWDKAVRGAARRGGPGDARR